MEDIKKTIEGNFKEYFEVNPLAKVKIYVEAYLSSSGTTYTGEDEVTNEDRVRIKEVYKSKSGIAFKGDIEETEGCGCCSHTNYFDEPLPEILEWFSEDLETLERLLEVSKKLLEKPLQD